MTSGFVLDASTTLQWAFDDESTTYSDAVLDLLIDGFAVVPALWHYEVANALVVGMRRSRVSSDDVAAFAADLALLDIRVAGQAPGPGLLAMDAHESGLTAYDAAYLSLARDAGLPLATRDRALMRAARSAGVAMLAP